MVRAMSLVGCKNFIVNKPEQIVDNTEVLPEGILVFVNQATLEHKKRDGKKSKGCFCYWETKRVPKKFIEKLHLEEAERVSYEQGRYELIKNFAIYFAIKGKVKGYFIVDDLKYEQYEEIWMCFNSESWHEIEEGDILKASQGWRYYPK